MIIRILSHIWGLYFLKTLSVVVIFGFRRILIEERFRNSKKSLDEKDSGLWILNVPSRSSHVFSIIACISISNVLCVVTECSSHSDEIVRLFRKSSETLKINNFIERMKRSKSITQTVVDQIIQSCCWMCNKLHDQSELLESQTYSVRWSKNCDVRWYTKMQKVVVWAALEKLSGCWRDKLLIKSFF